MPPDRSVQPGDAAVHFRVGMYHEALYRGELVQMDLDSAVLLLEKAADGRVFTGRQAIPLKLKAGSGSPVRAFALLD